MVLPVRSALAEVELTAGMHVADDPFAVDNET